MHAEEETEKRTALSSLDSILLRSVQHPEHVGQTLPPRSAGAGHSDGLTVDGQPERDQNMPRERERKSSIPFLLWSRERTASRPSSAGPPKYPPNSKKEREREKREKNISYIHYNCPKTPSAQLAIMRCGRELSHSVLVVLVLVFFGIPMQSTGCAGRGLAA